MKRSLSLDVSRLLGFKLVAGEKNQKDAPSPEVLCRDARIGAKIGKPDGVVSVITTDDHPEERL